jgi:hypothetical protein
MSWKWAGKTSISSFEVPTVIPTFLPKEGPIPQILNSKRFNICVWSTVKLQEVLRSRLINSCRERFCKKHALLSTSHFGVEMRWFPSKCKDNVWHNCGWDIDCRETGATVEMVLRVSHNEILLKQRSDNRSEAPDLLTLPELVIPFPGG